MATIKKQTPETENEFRQMLKSHLSAGYQMIYVQTAEEARAEDEIKIAAKEALNADVIIWDVANGFSDNAPECFQNIRNTPHAALSAIYEQRKESEKQNNYVFIFRDLDDYFMEPVVRRNMQTLAGHTMLVNNHAQWPIIVVSKSGIIHHKLQALLPVLEMPLPDATMLEASVDRITAVAKMKDPLEPVLKRKIVDSLRGLTALESEDCLSRCYVQCREFDHRVIPVIKAEKARMIKKSQVLQCIQEDSLPKPEDLGGFNALMDWIDKRKLAYHPAARTMLIDPPRGITITGVPGTGKSQCAMAIASALDLPCYRLDVGALFGSRVGESEERTRDTFRTVDAQNGCVLMIDEADKGLGGSLTSSGDSGVTRRVFGTLLTWLAESKSNTFTVMTLNRTDGLPPELLRAGRFDAMFYTDIPTASVRRSIFEIHLRKRGVPLDQLDFGEDEWAELISATENYVGAEIEEVVRSARYAALTRVLGKYDPSATNIDENAIPMFDELITATTEIKPMASQDGHDVQQIRDFCAKNAKPVAYPEAKKHVSTTRRISPVST